MDQITVVLVDVGSVRVCRGHMSRTSMEQYLEGLDPGLHSVEFHLVDLYSDVGNATAVYRWTPTQGRWSRVG